MYIENRLLQHLYEAQKNYPDKDWFVICLQGSQNYGIADLDSDIDSKMLILPTLKDLVLNYKAISHTLEMPDNKEHIDIKDTREYFKIFRKSNINFVEILFTDWYLTNPMYTDLWLELRRFREELARINPYAAISCMKGMASEKLHALCHEYPSRMEYINKFGYDPKQLSHLIRIKYFIVEYVKGEEYKNCIYPKDEEFRRYLLDVKRNGVGSALKAKELAEITFEDICQVANTWRNYYKNENDSFADQKLNDVLYELMERNIKNQLT